MLEERLLDRQQELQGMLGSVKSFLQDLADVLSWLDVKEKELDGAVAVASSEKEAKRRLKEYEVCIFRVRYMWKYFVEIFCVFPKGRNLLI